MEVVQVDVRVRGKERVERHQHLCSVKLTEIAKPAVVDIIGNTAGKRRYRFFGQRGWKTAGRNINFELEAVVHLLERCEHTVVGVVPHIALR